MAFAAAYRGLARRWRAALPLLAAAAWVAAELGRARLFSGNPWALAGYSQVGLLPLVQIADVTGVYGVSFVVVAVNEAVAEVWLAARGPRGAWRPALAGLVVAFALTGGVLAYGTFRLGEEARADDTRRVAIVQGNIDMGSQWVPELYGQTLAVYLRLTREALAGGPVDLVVWPESAMTFFLDQEPVFARAIAANLAGTELLAGGPRAADPVRPVYYNSAFLLRGDAIAARYDKERLLPFAEYFPIPALDLVRRRFGRVREFVAGPAGAAPLATAAGPAGVLICNEVMFPEVAAARVRAGAEVLVNLANDAWIGEARFAAMTFDMARMRAVEQRRWVVRASTSGPSGVVDGWGRVVTVTPEGPEAVVREIMSPRNGLTSYASAGDAFALGCLLVAVGALARNRAPIGPTRRIPERSPRSSPRSPPA
jgi:apolipoprotein N-acyltransferase